MSKRAAKKPTVERHVKELERYLTKRGPDGAETAPTAERVRQADGNAVRAHVVRTPSGLATGNHYWRITPVIDALLRIGTIMDDEYDAALRYMRHFAGSRHKGPATSKYLPSYDIGLRDFTPPERAMHYGQMRARAESSVDPLLRPALRWLEKAAEDEWPLWKLGEIYYPGLTKQAQSNRAPGILHIALAMLARHYGMGHRFDASEIEIAVRRIRTTTVEVEEISIRR